MLVQPAIHLVGGLDLSPLLLDQSRARASDLDLTPSPLEARLARHARSIFYREPVLNVKLIDQPYELAVRNAGAPRSLKFSIDHPTHVRCDQTLGGLQSPPEPTCLKHVYTSHRVPCCLLVSHAKGNERG